MGNKLAYVDWSKHVNRLHEQGPNSAVWENIHFGMKQKEVRLNQL
jgi:hypothetical protein